MGVTIPLQELITIRGSTQAATNFKELIQPSSGWIDAKDFTDAVFEVRLLEKSKTGTAVPTLYVETAASRTGPWEELAEYGDSLSPPLSVSFAASSRSEADPILQRFIRWRIGITGAGGVATWNLCFGICVTLK